MPNATKLSQVMADGGGNLTVFMFDANVSLLLMATLSIGVSVQLHADVGC
jgi:hypothetical protein